MLTFRKNKKFTVHVYYPSMKMSSAGIEIHAETWLCLRQTMIGIQFLGFGIGLVV